MYQHNDNPGYVVCSHQLSKKGKTIRSVDYVFGRHFVGIPDDAVDVCVRLQAAACYALRGNNVNKEVCHVVGTSLDVLFWKDRLSFVVPAAPRGTCRLSPSLLVMVMLLMLLIMEPSLRVPSVTMLPTLTMLVAVTVLSTMTTKMMLSTKRVLRRLPPGVPMR